MGNLEVLEVGNSAAIHQGGSGDSKSLWTFVVAI
jgi:hypothetical protein